MVRRTYIERLRRQIYNGQPNDDATITVNLVNLYVDDAIAFAAKSCYTESIKLDGIAYVNGGFYTTYKGLTISADENFIWRVTLPHIPYGLGESEGVSTLQVKDGNNVSLPVIWISQAQKSYYHTMRAIPNKVMAFSEGKYIYIITPILLNQYTANVTMVSGGNSSDLDSEINVPQDYYPLMTDYILKQLLLERNQPTDVNNDGLDVIKTT
jgi:hypothetical protein